MKQENKEILLQDLCSRLPYGVIIEHGGNLSRLDTIFMCDSISISSNSMDKKLSYNLDLDEVKPYLFPLSSMTEGQKEELITITNGKFRYMWDDITNAIPRKNTGEWGISENAFINGIEVINILYIWLLKNHFDINGLIPIGLSIDATNLGIYE